MDLEVSQPFEILVIRMNREDLARCCGILLPVPEEDAAAAPGQG